VKDLVLAGKYSGRYYRHVFGNYLLVERRGGTIQCHLFSTDFVYTGVGRTVTRAFLICLAKMDQEGPSYGERSYYPILLNRLTEADGGRVRIVDTDYSSEIRPLRRQDQDPFVSGVKESWRLEQDHIDFTGYVHTADRKDVTKEIQGLIHYLNDYGRAEVTDDELAQAILLMIYELPVGEDGPMEMLVPPVAVGDYLPNNSSPGFVYGKSQRLKGTKAGVYNEILDSFDKFCQDCKVGIPQTIPNCVSFKPEVVKCDKKTRTIQVSSSTYQIVCKNSILPVFDFQKNWYDCDFQGLEMKEGSTVKVLYSLDWKRKRINREFGVPNGSVEFVELDQSEFESRLELTTGILYMLQYFMLASDNFVDEHHFNIVAATFYSYLFPIYTIGNSVFFVNEGSVGSGHGLTSNGNTNRHKWIHKLYAAHALVCESKACEFCESKDDYSISTFYRCNAFMSDDHLGINTKLTPGYIKFCEQRLKLKPKLRVCGEDEKPEFLRMTVEKTGFGYVSLREEERLFNKIYHGKHTILTLAEAVISAMYLAGNHAGTYDRLDRLYLAIEKELRKVSVGDVKLKDEKTGVEIDLLNRPSFAECVVFQSYGMKNMEKWHNRLIDGQFYHVCGESKWFRQRGKEGNL
jgi:hypothetical protein